MKISVIFGIVILVTFLVIVTLAEFVFADKEHGSIYLDPYKNIMKAKIEQTNDPVHVLNHIDASIDNQPFIYRQTFLMAIFGSLLCTNFLFILFPQFKIDHFFPVFFALSFVMFIEFAFINFHYYKQKEDMVKMGTDRVRTLLVT
jgi:hypothetical protein